MDGGKLYICPTPIGNLKDVTMRVLEVLAQADTVCAEDTRVSARLLAAYGIEKRVERLDEVTLSKHLDRIIERLQNGETIAYCSDAGMPGVSDPGLRLVRAAQEAQVTVEVLPGASAGVTAYVASGFASSHYYFGGFFPRKDKERIEIIQTLGQLDAVLVFYESPRRLVSSLKVIAEQLPFREVAVCRELTKLYEEIVRTSAPEIYKIFSSREQQSQIKGEIVICIDAASVAEQEDRMASGLERASDVAASLKREGTHSNKDIVGRIQKEFGISRNAAYDIVVGS